MRSKGKNMLHTALLVAMNFNVWRRGALVFASLQQFRLFRGLQIIACKTTEGTAKWYSEMAAYSWLEPLLETWGSRKTGSC